jgi:uncharacterized protein YndB with AHSA1/START domain
MTTDATRSVVIEREMPFPPEKIWRALTDGVLMKQWLMDNDFQPVVGKRFNFRATPMPRWNGVIDCEVQVVEANRTLSYSWSSLGVNSVVVWTLSATTGGTMVRMEQSGFRADQQANYDGASYGWSQFIGGLERIIAGLR